jgi:hemerythrin superfamily protein
MNAVELLKQHHQEINLLFQKVKADKEGEKHRELFEKIKQELEVHAHIEETIFYPRLKEEEDLKDIVLEGIEEHHQAKMFLRELSNLVEDSEKFEPKLKVLIEDTIHHVQEEEGEMFPQTEELIDAETLDELGKQMEAEMKSYKKSQTAKSGK